jgi:hypothetical protein
LILSGVGVLRLVGVLDGEGKGVEGDRVVGIGEKSAVSGAGPDVQPISDNSGKTTGNNMRKRRAGVFIRINLLPEQ